MTRFVMIGGFLGSGKTTAIVRLARMSAVRGRRVGIVANDLGQGLVDTQTYLAQGLPVEEMAGVCFACRFDELIAAAGRLEDGPRPDVLLAEPAGSCTNIVSRVVEPLKELYANRFRIAPYVTLLDPQRAYEALTGEGQAGFSAKVLYLYKMQQNEADIVAINKVDTLAPGRREELRELVARNFPQAKVMLVSARTGQGFEHLAEALDGGDLSGQHPLGVEDFDRALSAAGDARLAWLNATWRVTAAEGFEADRLLIDLAEAIQGALVYVEGEPAHVKMIVRDGAALAMANLVSSDRAPELSQPCSRRMTDGMLVVNARVEIAPTELAREIDGAIRETAAAHGVEATCLSSNDRAADLVSRSWTTDADTDRGGS